MTYKTDSRTPPPFIMCDYFERCGDPWHAEAFAQLDFGDNPVLIGGQGIDTSCVRKQGWMAIDWCENAVGFIADGTEFDGVPPEFTIREGYFKDKRKFAYPVAEWVDELIKRHDEYRKNNDNSN